MACTAVHEHEVFGPVATLLPYGGDVAELCGLVQRGDGSLVASVFSDDLDFVRQMVLGIGAWHGRLYLGSTNGVSSPGRPPFDVGEPLQWSPPDGPRFDYEHPLSIDSAASPYHARLPLARDRPGRLRRRGHQ